MLVPELLLETLEHLNDDEFRKFKWYMSLDILEGCQPIPRSHLENASRTNTVDRLRESYREELAVIISIEVLKKMKNNMAAEQLQSKYGGET